MRTKLLIVITALMYSLGLSSQNAFNYLGVDVEGFYSKTDSTKRYTVLEFEDLSQKELFEYTKMFIDKRFALNIKKVNTVEFKSIVLNVSDIVVFEFASNTKGTADAIYSIDFTFKDGAIKVDVSPAFIIKMGANETVIKGSNSPLIGLYPIYNNKDELKRKKVKQQIEFYFNSLLFELENFITDSGSDEDW